VEYIPGLHKIYTSDWGEEKIGVVDLKLMKVVKRLPTAEKPNRYAPRYAPEQQEDGLPVARIMIYQAVLSPPAKPAKE
jgi:hypothetical protein